MQKILQNHQQLLWYQSILNNKSVVFPEMYESKHDLTKNQKNNQKDYQIDTFLFFKNLKLVDIMKRSPTVHFWFCHYFVYTVL